jgi:hypothetical protein
MVVILGSDIWSHRLSDSLISSFVQPNPTMQKLKLKKKTKSQRWPSHLWTFFIYKREMRYVREGERWKKEEIKIIIRPSQLQLIITFDKKNSDWGILRVHKKVMTSSIGITPYTITVFFRAKKHHFDPKKAFEVFSYFFSFEIV